MGQKCLKRGQNITENLIWNVTNKASTKKASPFFSHIAFYFDEQIQWSVKEI